MIKHTQCNFNIIILYKILKNVMTYIWYPKTVEIYHFQFHLLNCNHVCHNIRSHGSAISIVAGLRTGQSGVWTWMLSFPKCPDHLWGPHSLRQVTGTLSLGVNRPGREANHSSPSCAKVNNKCSYISTYPTRFQGTHRNNFTFVCQT